MIPYGYIVLWKKSRSILYDYFGTKPKSYYDSVQASGNMEATSTTFGMYAATVYFNKEDVIERFDRDIAALERRKQCFIKDKEL